MRTDLSSMRHSVKLMVAAACMSMTVGVCAAETFPYGGILQPNVEYTFDMVELSATFIPSETGDVLYNCGTFIHPYTDSDHNPESYIDGVSQNYIGGSLTYSISVTKDVPVYFYADPFDVTWNAQPGMIFKITENEPIEIYGYSVDEGSVLSLTSGFDDLVIYANQGIKASSAKISVDGTATEVNVLMEDEFSPSLAVNYVSAIESLLNAGSIKGGEDLTITVYEIVNSSGVLYNNGEPLTIKYKAPSMPVSLIDVTMPDPFLAYWKPGDSDALITARYSGPISKMQYLLKYGDFEREEPDGYIEEGDSDDPECPAKITIDGDFVTIDLSGKQRRPADMVPSGMDYGNIIVKIYAYDNLGEPVKGSAPGQVGSYERELTYLYISPANFKTTFTPASGETLTGHDNLYLHLYDYEKIAYTGVRFTIDNEAYIVVPKSDITETGGPDFDWTLTIPVPEAAKTAAKVTVTFEDASFLDREDHSSEFTAEYYGTTSVLDNTDFLKPGEVSERTPLNVYTTDGRTVMTDGTPDDLPALTPGIYIINGKTVIIR